MFLFCTSKWKTGCLHFSKLLKTYLETYPCQTNTGSLISRFLIKSNISLSTASHPHMHGRLILLGDSCSSVLHFGKSCQVTLSFVQERLYSTHLWKTDIMSPSRTEGRFFFLTKTIKITYFSRENIG